MNWTGGRLSRHSSRGAAASLNQCQEAHFAKVQNNLRNGIKKRSPIKWSIFDKFQVTQASRERESSVEPPRYREESQQPHYGALRREGHEARDRLRSQLLEPQRIRQSTSGTGKQERVPDNDLYSATPPPQGKRKREASVSENKDEEADKRAQRRKRLLEKGDWVGISYQRPLQLAFTSPKHTENVGRRRQATDGHRARYASQQTTIESLFMTRARSHSPLKYNTWKQREKMDVRIHVGNRVVPPGISSSTAPSRSRGHSLHRRLQKIRQVSSSDVMLLDNEDVLSSAISRIIDETPMEEQGVEPFGSDIYDERPLNHEDASGNDSNRSGRNDRLSHSWDSQIVGHENISAPERQCSPSMGTQGMPYTHSREPSVPPIYGITWASFSPSSIKQPIPQSSRVSSVLCSASSEIPCSTVAQVGKVKPVVPSSQVLDNEIWETWMGPLYDEEQFDEQHDENESMGCERPISPGISTTPGRRVELSASVPYHEDAEEDEAEKIDEVDNASRMVNASVGDFSITEDHQEERQAPRNVLRRDPADRSGRRIVDEGPRDTRDLRRNPFRAPSPVPDFEPRDDGHRNLQGNLHDRVPEQTLLAKADTISKLAKGQDPDDIWRTFVFGSDEADETDHISKPASSPRFEGQNLTAPPMLGHPSTAISAKSPTYAAQQCRNTPSHSNSKSHTPSTIISNTDSSSSEVPWNPPMGVPPARIRLTLDDSTSLHTSDHSHHSSHSDPALPSEESTSSSKSANATTSLAVVASSQSQSSEIPASPRCQKVVFTKSKRCEGTNTASESSQVEEEPLHIGRSLMRDSRRIKEAKMKHI